MNTAESYDKFKEIFDKKTYDKVINVLSAEGNAKHFTRLMSYMREYNIAIVLDEIDFLYRKSNEISFYEIINIPYITGTNVKMILISNNSDFDNEIFPKLKNRKIQINKIDFKPYTPLELFNIMKKKLEDIKMQNCFSDDSIRFLATKLNKSGDLRPIIETVKNIILSNKEEFLTQSKTIELKDMFAVLKQKNLNLSEQLRQEQLKYNADIFNLNIGTIQAQPYSLSKTTAFTANNKIFPILEYYTCSNEEKDLVATHIINYSMTVGAIGKLKDYIKNTWQYNNVYARNFIKGTFLKLKDLFEDYHYLNALNEELNIGVYFDEYTE